LVKTSLASLTSSALWFGAEDRSFFFRVKACSFVRKRGIAIAFGGATVLVLRPVLNAGYFFLLKAGKVTNSTEYTGAKRGFPKLSPHLTVAIITTTPCKNKEHTNIKDISFLSACVLILVRYTESANMIDSPRIKT
jgi:hypothetical protein